MRGDKGEASEDTNVLTGLGECGTCCALGTDHDDAAGTKMLSLLAANFGESRVRVRESLR
jgi:hypothetical protein